MQCERYVIDTNILIAASAANPDSSVSNDATPEDPALRLQVLEWLIAFDSSTTRLVLDGPGKIWEEYQNKLGFNDYGRQVIMHKWSTAAVDNVKVAYDENGHAVLEESLALIIHDLSDRKMVAVVLEALKTCPPCVLANASDTDWYDWQETLAENGIEVEQIIHEWAHAKWLEKKAREK